MALKLSCKPLGLRLLSKITYDVNCTVQKFSPLFLVEPSPNCVELDRKFVHCWLSPYRPYININSKDILVEKKVPFINYVNVFARRKSTYYDTPERGDLPEAPKKPLSPPLVYVNEQKKEAKETGQTILSTTQYLEIWSKLSEKEKAKYQLTYQELLAVYKEKFLEYKNNLTEEEIFKFKKFLLEKKKIQLRKESAKLSKTINNSYAKEAELLGKPKYPGSSIYIYWQSLLSEQGERKLAMPHVIEKWNLLPEKEKEIFKKLFKERFAIYKAELEAWEQRMSEEGKQHLIRKGKIDKLDKIKDNAQDTIS